MNTPDDQTLKWIMGIIASLFAAMIGWLYNGTIGRIKKVEEKLDAKADTAEMTRQRDNIGELFGKLDEHARRDEDTFRTITSTMSENQAELLREIAKRPTREELKP